MDGIRLRESSVIEPEKPEVSVDMRSVHPGDMSYNWNGNDNEETAQGWSYTKYMKKQEEEEEEKRKEQKKFDIIVIND